MRPTTAARIALALAAALGCATQTRAQGGQQAAAPTPEDRYVTQKGFNNRVFEVRNRDPLGVARVLSPLGSGFRGAVVSPNQEFGTITVRDFPENISAMEEALRRLDVPEQPRPGVEFQVHLLVASNDAAVQNNLPAELSDVTGRLRASLGYRNFSLMGSQVVRSRDGRGEAYNKGVAELKLAGDTAAARNPVFYQYNIRSVSLDGGPGGARVQVEEFSLDLRIPLALSPDKVSYESVGFKNPVSLREGERVVVGTTSVGDKSVVVVISAGTMK